MGTNFIFNLDISASLSALLSLLPRRLILSNSTLLFNLSRYNISSRQYSSFDTENINASYLREWLLDLTPSFDGKADARAFSTTYSWHTSSA